MNITFNPAYNYNYNRHSIQFKGEGEGELGIGVQVVGEIHANTTDPNRIIQSAKGPFGMIYTDRLKAIIASMMEEIKTLAEEKREAETKLTVAKQDLASVRAKINDARNEGRADMKPQIEALTKQNIDLAQKLNKTKLELDKYSLFANVRSVDEIEDNIKPARVSQVLDEMVENNIKACQSMEDYLFNASTPSDFIKQLDRNTVIQKANNLGLFNQPELSLKLKDTEEKCNIVHPGVLKCIYIEDTIRKVLSCSNKIDELYNEHTKNQVIANATALIHTYVEREPGTNKEKYSNYTTEEIKERIKNMITMALNYNNNFKNGINKIKKNYPENTKIVLHPVKFNYAKSYIETTTPNGEIQKMSYNSVAYYGSAQ